MSIYRNVTVFTLTAGLGLASCQTVDLLPTSEFTSEPGHETSFTPTTEAPGNLCENGECNDDNLLDSDGCFECKWTCDAEPECEETPQNCPSQCSSSNCGDGKISGEETCECGGDDGDPCVEELYWKEEPLSGSCYNCTLAQWCGDGVKNGAEACDTKGQSADCEAECTKVVCGDGIVNSLGGEECEGDLDCSMCRFVRRRVFVTSLRYCGDMGEYKQLDSDPPKYECNDYPADKGSEKGVGRADQRCADLAEKEGILKREDVKAWLSVTSSDGENMENPKHRFDASTKGFGGRYVMIRKNNEEVVVAEGWHDLTDGTLGNAILVTENGENINSGGSAWTNTLIDGDAEASQVGNDCNDWSSRDGSDLGNYGLAAKADAQWTVNDSAKSKCSSGRRLYCFEDPAP